MCGSASIKGGSFGFLVTMETTQPRGREGLDDGTAFYFDQETLGARC